MAWVSCVYIYMYFGTRKIAKKMLHNTFFDESFDEYMYIFFSSALVFTTSCLVVSVWLPAERLWIGSKMSSLLEDITEEGAPAR